MGTNIKNPDVGFGVVGTKTLNNFSSSFFFTSPCVSAPTKPITHKPFRGYSRSTHLLKALSCDEKNVSNTCLSNEYILEITGSLRTIQSPKCTKNLPTKPAANIPITVNNKNNNKIPSPGMVIGILYFSINSGGINLLADVSIHKNM